MLEYNRAALAAAADSAAVKALTGDPATDMYAEAGLLGAARLKDLPAQHPDWAKAYLSPDGRPIGIDQPPTDATTCRITPANLE